MLRVGVKINYFPQVNWFPTIIDRDCVFLRTALSFIINTYFDNFVSINDWEEPIYLNPNTQKILLKTSKKTPCSKSEGIGLYRILWKLWYFQVLYPSGTKLQLSGQFW